MNHKQEQPNHLHSALTCLVKNCTGDNRPGCPINDDIARRGLQ